MLLLDSIVNHCKLESALNYEDAFITTKSGQRRRKYTTAGWEFCCCWKDGTISWAPLNIMKESHPVEVAEICSITQIRERTCIYLVGEADLKKRETLQSTKSNPITS